MFWLFVVVGVGVLMITRSSRTVLLVKIRKKINIKEILNNCPVRSKLMMMMMMMMMMM
jgi:hypothetical protein